MAKLELISDKELAKDIIEKYVNKLQKDYNEKRSDLPGYSMELFGVECGEGWYGIIAALIKYIEEYNETHSDEPIIVHQIKEKFGELRFYTNFVTPELDDLIEEAEGIAWNTCETCGSTKNIGHTMGWVSVVCPDCIAKRIENYPNNTIKWSDRGQDNKPAVVHEINANNIKEFLKLFEN